MLHLAPELMVNGKRGFMYAKTGPSILYTQAGPTLTNSILTILSLDVILRKAVAHTGSKSIQKDGVWRMDSKNEMIHCGTL